MVAKSSRMSGRRGEAICHSACRNVARTGVSNHQTAPMHNLEGSAKHDLLLIVLHAHNRNLPLSRSRANRHEVLGEGRGIALR